MAWGQYIELYAFRDNPVKGGEPIDVDAIGIKPNELEPLEFAKKLKEFARAIEKAEKKYPGQVYINTNT